MIAATGLVIESVPELLLGLVLVETTLARGVLMEVVLRRSLTMGSLLKLLLLVLVI